ncbi:LOW QUALITY PROTEIN: uncharacterized protein LOC144611387 [Rhinoraja longicauda]
MAERWYFGRPGAEMDEEDEALNHQLDLRAESLTPVQEGPAGGQAPPDPSTCNVVVTRLTILCEDAPKPIAIDLTVSEDDFLPPPGVQRSRKSPRVPLDSGWSLSNPNRNPREKGVGSRLGQRPVPPGTVTRGWPAWPGQSALRRGLTVNLVATRLALRAGRLTLFNTAAAEGKKVPAELDRSLSAVHRSNHGNRVFPGRSTCPTCPARPLLLLATLLSLPSLVAPSTPAPSERTGGYQEETEDEIQKFLGSSSSPDVMRPVRVLRSVSRAETFINSVPVAVIGFLKDMESTEAEAFGDVVQMLKRLPFAITSDTSVWKSFNISRNTISLFKKFDEGRADYLVEEGHLEPNVTKIVRFLRIHELRLVTEYNHMDASQIFGSGIPIHILLLVSKTSKEYQPLLDKFKGVAPEFRGKVIFVLVDANMKQNHQAISFFKVTEPELPAICAFHVVTNAVKVMQARDGTPDSIRRFCTDFIQANEEPQTKPPMDEL